MQDSVTKDMVKKDDILLRNVLVDDKPVDMAICGGLIRSIRPSGATDGSDTGIGQAREVVDCTWMAAVPGFFNMHTHAAMSLMRGVGEDAPNLHAWLDGIWKIEAHLDADFCYWATKVACIEMLRTGTTTYNDMYFYPEACAKAAVEVGVRPAWCYCILDLGDREKAAREREGTERAYEAAATLGGIFEVSFHSIYTVSEENMLWAADFARKHGLKLHIHLSETRKEVEDCKARHGGLSPVEYLDRLGILGPDLIAAHSLWLSEKDIELLGSHRVTCVHNINSNTKLASGYRFMYNELRDAGANVCLGTDGCASSNNLDMLEAMKTSALFAKAWRSDTQAMPLPELLKTATENGAKAYGLNAGRIAEGAEADICLIDTRSNFFLSPAPFLANLVYSAHSDCIDSVMAGGRFVMRHRVIPGEAETLEAARLQLAKIRA